MGRREPVGTPDLWLKDYVQTALPRWEAFLRRLLRQDVPKGLAPAPTAFGLERFYPISGWGMLANDRLGDCVEAGSCHQVMAWTASHAIHTLFTDYDAIALYSAITGYTPSNPNSDQGTDMLTAAKYLCSTGFKDATGRLHKAGAFLGLQAEDPAELADGCYYFGTALIGVNLPSAWQDAFKPDGSGVWDVCDSPIEGGHCVVVVGRRANGNFVAVTWGSLVEITPGAIEKYCDEAFVFLSQDFLNGQGKTVEGFDLAQLQADLKAL
ncbi:hypothetical protein [Tsukamurella soli]|uniref:hypothetical protein n=1 Tax=Tsukamurella soli TaxID=644556 RepID=UPI0031E84A8D